MRLGGPVRLDGDDFERYARDHAERGYTAALCPDALHADDERAARRFADVMADHGLVVAEVGAWSNPMSADPAERRQAIAHIVERLRLADLIGARTCVNIVGSKGGLHWFSPTPAGYDDGFFREAVDVTRYVIDEAKPVRTTYSVEMMPYCFLDCAEEYLRFMQAVRRPALAVHMDVCNAVNTPRRLYGSAGFVRHTFGLLGERIVSCHLKDLTLRQDAVTVRFDEVRIGDGDMDMVAVVGCIRALPHDVPAMLEHLDSDEDYRVAAERVRRLMRMS